MTRLDLAFEAAVWAAIAGGTVLFLGYFVAPPTPLLLLGAILWLASVIAAFVLGVVVSHAEGVGVLRAFGRGLRGAASWVFWFLP